MKFKVLRNSDTVKKITPIEKRAFEAQKKIATDLGFYGWQRGPFCVFEGIDSVIPKNGEKLDPKLWKMKWECYYPKANSKEGRSLIKLLEEVPNVGKDELNEAAGYMENGGFRNCIEISFNDKTFYGFSVGDNWDFDPSSDCEEITVSEYKRLFD